MIAREEHSQTHTCTHTHTHTLTHARTHKRSQIYKFKQTKKNEQTNPAHTVVYCYQESAFMRGRNTHAQLTTRPFPYLGKAAPGMQQQEQRWQ